MYWFIYFETSHRQLLSQAYVLWSLTHQRPRDQLVCSILPPTPILPFRLFFLPAPSAIRQAKHRPNQYTTTKPDDLATCLLKVKGQSRMLPMFSLLGFQFQFWFLSILFLSFEIFWTHVRKDIPNKLNWGFRYMAGGVLIWRLPVTYGPGVCRGNHADGSSSTITIVPKSIDRTKSLQQEALPSCYFLCACLSSSSVTQQHVVKLKKRG